MKSNEPQKIINTSLDVTTDDHGAKIPVLDVVVEVINNQEGIMRIYRIDLTHGAFIVPRGTIPA